MNLHYHSGYEETWLRSPTFINFVVALLLKKKESLRLTCFSSALCKVRADKRVSRHPHFPGIVNAGLMFILPIEDRELKIQCIKLYELFFVLV